MASPRDLPLSFTVGSRSGLASFRGSALRLAYSLPFSLLLPGLSGAIRQVAGLSRLGHNLCVCQSVDLRGNASGVQNNRRRPIATVNIGLVEASNSNHCHFFAPLIAAK